MSENIRILVYDDLREFRSTSPYVKNADITYCKTEAEFNEFMLEDEAQYGDTGTGVDVLILDHDLGLVFEGAEMTEKSTRRSAIRYAQRLEGIPIEHRPNVIIVTANPAGREYFQSTFSKICMTDIDPMGSRLGMFYP